MTPALGIRQRLLLARLRRAPLDWHPCQGRDLAPAQALAARGLCELSGGMARALPVSPRQLPAAGLMRRAQQAPDRPG